MYELYWRPNTASLAVEIVLNETQAMYTSTRVDDIKSQSYLRIHPRGQIPAIRSPNGEIITETLAICLHIAETHSPPKLIPATGTIARAQTYRWLSFINSHLMDACRRVLMPHRFSQGETAHSVSKMAAKQITSDWRLFADAVQGPYFFGQNYSLIDAFVIMVAVWTPDPLRTLLIHPKLAKMLQRIYKRPAVITAFENHQVSLPWLEW